MDPKRPGCYAVIEVFAGMAAISAGFECRELGSAFRYSANLQQRCVFQDMFCNIISAPEYLPSTSIIWYVSASEGMIFAGTRSTISIPGQGFSCLWKPWRGPTRMLWFA